MRRVADRLGIGTMSLYTYVPGKAELLDVMLDTVLGEVAGPGDVGGMAGEARGGRAGELGAISPAPLGAAGAPLNRPPLGPNVIAKYDRELRAVEGIGLTDVEMDSVLTLVLEHVQGSARRSVEVAEAEKRTGMTDDDWWSANAPLLEKVFDPNASRPRRASGRRRRRPTGPRTTPSTPSSSACSACSTASRRSSTRVDVRGTQMFGRRTGRRFDQISGRRLSRA